MATERGVSPEHNGLADLGSSTQRWGKLFVNDIDAQNIDAQDVDVNSVDANSVDAQNISANALSALSMLLNGVNLSTQIIAASSFGNGSYVKFGNGLIIQWGYIGTSNFTSGTYGTIQYPISWTTGYVVVGTENSDDTAGVHTIQMWGSYTSPKTTLSFRASAVSSYFWIAIGK